LASRLLDRSSDRVVHRVERHGVPRSTWIGLGHDETTAECSPPVIVKERNRSVDVTVTEWKSSSASFDCKRISLLSLQLNSYKFEKLFQNFWHETPSGRGVFPRMRAMALTLRHHSRFLKRTFSFIRLSAPSERHYIFERNDCHCPLSTALAGLSEITLEATLRP
jgi:hypothetical protein